MTRKKAWSLSESSFLRILTKDVLEKLWRNYGFHLSSPRRPFYSKEAKEEEMEKLKLGQVYRDRRSRLLLSPTALEVLIHDEVAQVTWTLRVVGEKGYVYRDETFDGVDAQKLVDDILAMDVFRPREQPLVLGGSEQTSGPPSAYSEAHPESGQSRDPAQPTPPDTDQPTAPALQEPSQDSPTEQGHLPFGDDS